jgi:hypothetical protein
VTTPAWADSASPKAPAAIATVSATYLAREFNDRRHHGDRDDCRRFGGHEWFDEQRHRWYCRGGRDDGWWW